MKTFRSAARRKGKSPTFGSCIQNPRGKGGAFGALVPDAGIRPANGYFLCYLFSNHRAVEYRVPVDPTEWQEYEEALYSAAIQCHDPIGCGPVALQEPFKVRVITRGDAVRYHVAREWQPTLHRAVARLDPFHLTMGPAKPEHIEELLLKASQFDHAEDGFWVSGDYESATDNLAPNLSDHCLSAAAAELGIPHEDVVLLIKTLSQHMIEWVGRGDDGKDRPEKKLQEWGQLMGSPTSFPILCLVNAAITRFWYEKTFNRTFQLTSLPMLVNGDDILFWCPNWKAYEEWKIMVAKAGLKASVGKNFCSTRYLVINSEIWHAYHTVDYFGQNVWRLKDRLPTLNYGLLLNTEKSASSHQAEKTVFGSHHMQRDSFRQRAHDWVDGFPEDRDLMMSVFIKYQKDFLSKVPRGMSYYVHPNFGGLGLPVTREVTITDAQRKLAGMLWFEKSPSLKYQLLPTIQMPLPAFVESAMGTYNACLKGLKVRFSYDYDDTLLVREDPLTVDMSDYCNNIAKSKSDESLEVRSRLHACPKKVLLTDWSQNRCRFEPQGFIPVRAPVDGGPWKTLRHFYMTGFDRADPEGLGWLSWNFQKIFRKSFKHWAKPLAFRHCVEGPRGPLRPSHSVRWPC